MKQKESFYPIECAPEEKVDESTTIEAEEKTKIDAVGDTNKYLKDRENFLLEAKKLKIRLYVAFSLVITFCVITIIFTLAAIKKGDVSIIEKIWAGLGPLVGVIVGYLFRKSRD